MKKQRIVFDLDRTLLTYHPETEEAYFKDLFGRELAKPFLENIVEWLRQYESIFPRYDEDSLATFLTNQSGLVISAENIEDWVNVLATGTDTPEPFVYEMLEEFKLRGHSLAVLTNWFANTQIPRLAKADLIDFFDDIYTGEQFLKPHQDSYWNAIEFYRPEECVFIGDNIEKDYIGPKACGMDAILYDPCETHHKTLVKVKQLDELNHIIRR